MSALSAERGTDRFRSGPYLEQLLEPRPRATQRMAQRIATAAGISHQRVHQIIKQAGLTKEET